MVIISQVWPDPIFSKLQENNMDLWLEQQNNNFEVMLTNF